MITPADIFTRTLLEKKSNIEVKILYFMAVEFSDYEYTYMGFFEV